MGSGTGLVERGASSLTILLDGTGGGWSHHDCTDDRDKCCYGRGLTVAATEVLNVRDDGGRCFEEEKLQRKVGYQYRENSSIISTKRNVSGRKTLRELRCIRTG